MSNLIDYLRKIAKTRYLDDKIKTTQPLSDKPAVPSSRGVGYADLPPSNTPKVCEIHFSTDANSYDIADILAGTAGPTVAEQCSMLNTVTGLTDLDTSQASASLTAVVHLIIQIDGIFD